VRAVPLLRMVQQALSLDFRGCRTLSSPSINAAPSTRASSSDLTSKRYPSAFLQSHAWFMRIDRQDFRDAGSYTGGYQII
jgi:hypothetical protein